MSAPTFGRSSTAALGSYASPSSIAAGGNTTTTPLDLTGTSTVDGYIAVTLIIGGTAPTTAPTVAFQVLEDGTDAETVITWVCANAASTRYTYEFAPLNGAKKVQALITNGATTGITAYAVNNIRTAS